MRKIPLLFPALLGCILGCNLAQPGTGFAQNTSASQPNILYGAAVLTRARILAAQGIPLAPGVPRLTPLDTSEIENRCSCA